MFSFTLEILCAFLIAMSIIFISIELRARFDRNFLIFGLVNLLICLFCAVDIWIQPNSQSLSWTRLQHIVASFFAPLIIWNVMLMVKKETISIVKILFLLSGLFSLLFMTDFMLIQVGYFVKSTTLYNYAFGSYVLLTIAGLFYLLLTNIKQPGIKINKQLLVYIGGFIVLCTGGILDLLSIGFGHRVFSGVPTFSIIGELCFSLIATILFTEKLTAIIRNHQITFQKLLDAYKAMEEVQSLKELGQSTAIVTHEIKNYATVISGYAEILSTQSELSAISIKLTKRIQDAILRMSHFSNDILEFSKSRIIRDKQPLNLASLVTNCINQHFAQSNTDFVLCPELTNNKLIITGDWQKLEHVFFNLFKNSIEANAKHITLNTVLNATTLLCILSDDGEGCTSENIDKMFSSFFTTKKNTGGTGLGMCLVRSIIESHGGSISAVANNQNGSSATGVSMHISFPLFENRDAVQPMPNANIILIKERLEEYTKIVSIFQNALITPQIIQSTDELDYKSFAQATIVFASAPIVAKLTPHVKQVTKLVALVFDKQNGVIIANTPQLENPVYFREQSLLDFCNQDTAKHLPIN